MHFIRLKSAFKRLGRRTFAAGSQENEMNTTKKYPGHLALLAANVFFGLNMVVSKDLMNGVVSPSGLNALRFLAGALAFWIIGFFLKPEKVEKKDLISLLLAAVFGLMLNQTLFVEGLARTSSVNASVISTTLPMVTMFVSALLLKEPISLVKLSGVLVGGTGAVYLIISSGQGSSQGGNLLGDLLSFGSTIAFSLFLVLTKPITQKYSAVTVMKWLFLFAGAVVIPLSFKDIAAVDYTGMALSDGLSLGYTLLFATVLPYLILPIGQKRLRPTTQSMYNYVLPIVTFIAAVVAGTNALTGPKVFATVLVFAGVYIVTRSKSRADVEAAKQNHSDKVKALEKN
jgi:drug/metabolite transporter (DMT)-like permease